MSDSEHLNTKQLEQIKVELERIYREGAPINEMGDRVDLNQQVLPFLDLNKILAWAESLLPDTVVGHTVEATNCPVYRYLKDCGFTPRFITCGSIRGKGFVFVSSSSLGELIPVAMSKLVSLVDSQGKGGTPVTAQTLVMLIRQLQGS
jgi:hypothetical protein